MTPQASKRERDPWPVRMAAIIASEAWSGTGWSHIGAGVLVLCVGLPVMAVAAAWFRVKGYAGDDR